MTCQDEGRMNIDECHDIHTYIYIYIYKHTTIHITYAIYMMWQDEGSMPYICLYTYAIYIYVCHIYDVTGRMPYIYIYTYAIYIYTYAIYMMWQDEGRMKAMLQDKGRATKRRRRRRRRKTRSPTAKTLIKTMIVILRRMCSLTIDYRMCSLTIECVLLL